MLVLSRRPGERLTIFLDNNQVITLTVVGVAGKQVRLGIECPREYPVIRDELLSEEQLKVVRRAGQ